MAYILQLSQPFKSPTAKKNFINSLAACFLVTALTLDQSASAQNLFIDFGSCQYEPCAQANQNCCLFDDRID